jgi:1-acyl-sn-glycerol-3-phosphate acyltransferase
MPLRRVILTNVIRFLSWILLRLHFENVENIPASGGLIVATNHMSQADSAILLLNPVRKTLAALVADKYKNHPLIHFIVNSMPHIYIDRTRADFSALNSAVEYLKQGNALGVAPEGTRSKTASLIEGKLGAAFMAVRANVPVVAVGITGTENFRKNIMRLKRTPVTVRYGKPFLLPPLDPDDRSGSLQRATDEIMCQIAAQLPDKYHGVYAGRARIRELKETR